MTREEIQSIVDNPLSSYEQREQASQLLAESNTSTSTEVILRRLHYKYRDLLSKVISGEDTSGWMSVERAKEYEAELSKRGIHD